MATLSLNNKSVWSSIIWYLDISSKNMGIGPKIDLLANTMICKISNINRTSGTSKTSNF